MKTYLIVGSESSIAKYYIENYISRTNDKIICIDIRENSNHYSNVKSFKFDVKDNESYYNFINYLTNSNLKIDNVIFSIGSNPMKNFFESTIENFKQTIDINLISFFILIKKIFRFLNPQCSIIAIGSQNSIVGQNDRIDYSTSKAALAQLVKNIQLDFSKYSDKDIKVNCISPGFIATNKNVPIQKYEIETLLSKNINNKYVELYEISQIINMLFDDNINSFKGANIVIDNGYTIK
ncbi:hypothetical protein DOS70_01575 [Staphylococcus felis]|uniref:SDR family oxidoreductase n=1 Tax=Staphylococcus felis TaxID=46127 RepID=UPI000E28166D|nr:SDR family oxidoreductase [Staphylococcus felis]REH97592.1 hypothetical protein DOS70_01575 [Staphylococcus felis]